MSASTLSWRVLVLLLLLHFSSNSIVVGGQDHPIKNGVHANEYKKLLASTEDKEGLESIRALHEQLDDDNDGTIEPSETGDFIRADLNPGGNKQQQQLRQKSFHKKDSEITVKDLWTTWWRSEVHNWTVDQTVEWLDKSCGLSQYEQHFRVHHVTGNKLPLVAVGGSYLSKVVGISNPIHRSKITLKAMDVVLFGPPKEPSSTLKDVILTVLLSCALIGLFYAYRQNKKAQLHMKKMMTDLEGLAAAERTLSDMQDKLRLKDSQLESMGQEDSENLPDALEVSRLREEVEVLRNELQRAEVELEDKCWVAPPVLQNWLQLTYEMESATYNAKKRAAEEQLEMAKDMCEKLKRKRSSLVGAFVSTHGRSIDDVDRSIIDAKTALMEVTTDLAERTARWRQIEIMCGCQVVNNPGIAILQRIVRHVGIGGGSRVMVSRMSASLSQDDLRDDDTHSVAASSSHMTSVSSHLGGGPRATSSASAIPTSGTRTRRHIKHMSRESSKESSSSDELQEQQRKPGPSMLISSSNASSMSVPHIPGPPSLGSAATPPQPAVRRLAPKVGPGGKTMVKSLSQDAGSSMAANAASAVASVVVPTVSDPGKPPSPKMTPSVSDSQIQTVTSKPPLPHSKSSSNTSSLAAAASSTDLGGGGSLRPPTVQEEESCSAASDSGSLASSELDLNGKKTKKRRSFFNFRRKKEKIV